MGDLARQLTGEEKLMWRGIEPVAGSLRTGGRIKGRVHLHGVKMPRVMSEALVRVMAFGVEDPAPVFEAPSARTDPNVRVRVQNLLGRYALSCLGKGISSKICSHEHIPIFPVSIQN
jgi:hypothetical protein